MARKITRRKEAIKNGEILEDEKYPMGRPIKKINWDIVDERLMAGSPGTHIAHLFDMHVKTFYERVYVEKGMTFTEYSNLKRFEGEDNLRLKQYRKAMGIDDTGDTTMLIFLGKTRLKQTENHDVQVSATVDTNFTEIMQMFKSMRRDDDEPRPLDFD